MFSPVWSNIRARGGIILGGCNPGLSELGEVGAPHHDAASTSRSRDWTHRSRARARTDQPNDDLSPVPVANMLEFDVTMLTMISMTFGPQLTERRQGALLDTGSTAGMVPSARIEAGTAKSLPHSMFEKKAAV